MSAAAAGELRGGETPISPPLKEDLVMSRADPAWVAFCCCFLAQNPLPENVILHFSKRDLFFSLCNHRVPSGSDGFSLCHPDGKSGGFALPATLLVV